MQKKKFKIVPATYLLLIKNNKILLLRRFNTGFMDGKYSLVAGHLDGNESFSQSIIREAKEEADIILKPKNLKAVHIMNRFEPKNNVEIRERIDVFFMAKKWQGEIKNMEPDKCNNLSWFSINKLPPNIIPYIKQTINNIGKNIFYSEFGY